MSGTTTPADWYPDPSGRHELRYWTGTEWSDQVADAGVVTSDPLQPPAAVAAAETAPTTVSPVVTTDSSSRLPWILAGVAALAVLVIGAFLLLGGDDDDDGGGDVAATSVSTTAAPESSVTTAAPTTTAAPATTAAPETTAPPLPTSPGSTAYPQEVIDAFVNSCAAGSPLESCQCAIDRIQQDYTLEEFTALEQEYVATGVFPQDMLSLIQTCFG